MISGQQDLKTTKKSHSKLTDSKILISEFED